MHKRLAHRYPTEVVPGRHLGQRRVGRARPAAGRARRGAHRAARHPAAERAGRAAGRHRLRGGHEARPHVRHRPRRRWPTPAALDDAWYVERATMDRAARRRRWPTSTPPSVPYFSLALLPEPGHAATARARRRRRAGPAAAGEVVVVGTRAGRARLADPGGARRARGGRRPRRLRPLPRPGAAQPAPAPARLATTGRGRARRARARPGRRRAAGSRSCPSGDPGVFAMAARRAGGRGRRTKYADVPVRVLPGVTAAQRGGQPRSARRWATTTP